MTRRYKLVLAAALALIVLHELTLHVLAPTALLSRFLVHGEAGAALLVALLVAFMLLRVVVMLLVPALLLALLFDALALRIAYIRRRNRIGGT